MNVRKFKEIEIFISVPDMHINFLRVLRPALTALRPARFIQRPTRIKMYLLYI